MVVHIGGIPLQTMSGKQPGFRVAATGVVTELDHSFKVVKKLKLVGYVIPSRGTRRRRLPTEP